MEFFPNPSGTGVSKVVNYIIQSHHNDKVYMVSELFLINLLSTKYIVIVHVCQISYHFDEVLSIFSAYVS